MLISKYAIPYRSYMGLLAAMFLLAGLPACASFKNLLRPKEDPQMLEIQQRLFRISKLNSSTKQKVDDIHTRIVELQATADSLEANLNKLAARPMPSPEAPTSKEKLKPPETGIKVKTAPEKSVTGAKLKKAGVSPKLYPKREYKKAYEAYVKHRFDEAMALFKKFLNRYPKHDLADNAQYWIGETYYDKKDYSNAILAFKKVVAHYAERSKAPDALLKIGYSYAALKDLENARIYFQKVIKNYPFSKTEAKARAKLKKLGNQ
ncbi:MAG: tol-pal system protein YbgF [Desulfobacterales bacterium]|nr:tol-pal system protein YbgF [Desulfobacterales bacterium]